MSLSSSLVSSQPATSLNVTFCFFKSCCLALDLPKVMACLPPIWACRMNKNHQMKTKIRIQPMLRMKVAIQPRSASAAKSVTPAVSISSISLGSLIGMALKMTFLSPSFSSPLIRSGRTDTLVICLSRSLALNSE